MSVVGFDFGNLASKIAVARNRGIDVICNEVSSRATPSLVSFGYKQRYLGEAAKTQEISNFKNTIGSLKRLAGRTFQDREVQEIEKQYINAELVDEKGQVGVKVQYLGEERVFTNAQLISMYFTKLKEITSTELKIPMSDVVISVPGWFTDVQRRSILDAAEVAGLNCLRLLNDTTASALGYGITKLDLPENKPRNVAFVDIGHSTYSVAIVSFIKGQLTVRSTAYDRHLGGRDFDQVLVNHFIEVFREKYKIDVNSNSKALFRLRTAVEKLKKVLSANSQAPLNVESIMNDIDVSAIISRPEFEELSENLLNRIEGPLSQALQESELNLEDIHSVEVVGGSTRIPAIKERISSFFGKELNFTLNQDEAIARGCALQCAILSPVFKVREFSVQDSSHYPIKIRWENIPEIPDEESELTVFKKNNIIPSTKILTFYRKGPFDIEAHYEEPEKVPSGINPWIGRFSIKDVVPTDTGDLSIVKVKTRLNVHGVLSVEGAYIAEEVIKEEKEEPPKSEEQTKSEDQSSTATATATDTNNNNNNKDNNPDESQPSDQPSAQPSTPPSAQQKTKKVKKLVKKKDLQVVSGTSGLDKSIIAQFRELEGQMIVADKLVADTEAQKNTLEEYVYDIRGKLDNPTYQDFVHPNDREKLINLSNETEEWLYDEGADSTKSVYAEKLEELKKYGSPIIERHREHEERPKAEKSLRENIQHFILNASSNEEKYSHIPEEEKRSVVERATKASDWLNEKLNAQANLPQYETPVLVARDIYKERESLVHFASPILSKPKPKPEPKPEETPAPTENAENQNPEAPKPDSTTEEPSKKDNAGNNAGNDAGNDASNDAGTKNEDQNSMDID